MGVNLESVLFDPGQFNMEHDALEVLLKSGTDLSETGDIKPFFKKNRQLVACMGTMIPEMPAATELAFEFPFFGDFKADLLVGNKVAKRFCVVEFEDGYQNSIFKKHAALRSRFIIYRAAAKLETTGKSKNTARRVKS